jgi:hypothetical protein
MLKEIDERIQTHTYNHNPPSVGRSRMWIVKQLYFPIHRVCCGWSSILISS